MALITVLASILLLIALILARLNAALALLIASLFAGLLLGMPVGKLTASLSAGIGNTLGPTVMVLALGAMLGRLAESSGAAEKLVLVLRNLFGLRNIQWAILCTGLLTGIPLFYNAGFVVLIPLVFALAAGTGLPLLYVGLPMAASLSVTHGFLPPHPGPVALAGIFSAKIGPTLLYGLLISLPIAIVAGIVFPRLSLPRPAWAESRQTLSQEARKLPSAGASFLIVLLPVALIALGTLGSLWMDLPLFQAIRDPMIALLLSLLITIGVLRLSLSVAMNYGLEGVKIIAPILLIIAAGGAFKQVLVDSGIGDRIRDLASGWHLSPLFLGWLAAALFRVTLGSATVASLAAAGMVAPMVGAGAPPELMVLSVGAGSLFCSHVNDTGFWMFKEYFGLSLRQTFRTWTVMESIISLLGLAGVLLLQLLFF